MTRRILVAVSVVLALSGASVPSAAGQPEQAKQAEQVPKPNTEGLEPAVAALLDSTYTELAELSNPDSHLQASERAAKWGEAGEIFHAHGALDSTLACYRRALDLAPENPRWPYLVGYVLEGRGELTEALSLFKLASGLDPDPFTFFRIGQILLDQGRIGEAQAALEPLREIAGLQAAVRAQLGEAALMSGDHAAAVSNLSQALELQPEALSLHFPLSQAYRGLDNQAGARRHAELGGPGKVRAADPILQAIGERSVSSETFVNMGAQALKTGRTGVATAAYSKAVELNPDNQRAWMNLGVLAMEAGDSAEAERALRRALDLEPGYGFAHFNLAKLLNQGNRTEEALQHYRAAVTSNPGNLEFSMAYADQLMRAAEWQGAADLYESIALQIPDSARPSYLRALALVAAGDLDAASASARDAWKINPANPSIASAFVRLTSAVETAPDVRADALEVATKSYQGQRSVENGEQLAMALAAHGRFDDAVAIQQTLVRVLEENQAPEHLVAFARENLDRYRRRERTAAPWPPGI